MKNFKEFVEKKETRIHSKNGKLLLTLDGHVVTERLLPYLARFKSDAIVNVSFWTDGENDDGSWLLSNPHYVSDFSGGMKVRGVSKIGRK
jgi:hypothetical protein